MTMQLEREFENVILAFINRLIMKVVLPVYVELGVPLILLVCIIYNDEGRKKMVSVFVCQCSFQ